MSISKIKTKTVDAFAALAPGKNLEPYQYEVGKLNGWEILIKITHCGICHSDLHLINNEWKNSIYPLVPGHEIVGVVQEKGSLVSELQVGDKVGVGWQRSSCGQCEFCHHAEEHFCSKQEATCLGHFGGFATDIVVDSRFSFPIPRNLASEYAAPLLCGGATVFSPLLFHKIDATKKVGVIGIGGLGHLAIQFAAAFGCEVVAFSSSARKKEEAFSFGAHNFIQYQDKNSLQKVDNSLDLILFTGSSAIDFPSFFGALRPKGTFCILGAPHDAPITLTPFDLSLARKCIDGSNIASPFEIRQMLDFATQKGIAPKIELFSMHEANRALKKLHANEIHYRAVLINEGE